MTKLERLRNFCEQLKAYKVDSLTEKLSEYELMLAVIEAAQKVLHIHSDEEYVELMGALGERLKEWEEA